MKRFTCHCCGASIKTDKPQDPQRDYGFGTCERCRDVVAESWVRHGFLSCPLTLEQAHERLRKYA